jgi:hypothetical protein
VLGPEESVKLVDPLYLPLSDGLWVRAVEPGGVTLGEPHAVAADSLETSVRDASAVTYLVRFDGDRCP